MLLMAQSLTALLVSFCGLVLWSHVKLGVARMRGVQASRADQPLKFWAIQFAWLLQAGCMVYVAFWLLPNVPV